MTKVVFPCDQDTWWQVKDGLHTLKELSQQPGCDLRILAEAHQSLVNTSLGLGENDDDSPVMFNSSAFYGLTKYLRKHVTTEERDHFLQQTLPAIIDLALRIENLLPAEGILISEQQKCETREVDRQLCCAILACAFLCLFPNENRGYRKKLNSFNFKKFFDNLPIPSQNAKLRCILHFFDRVIVEWNRLTGSIFFTRQVVRRNELPTLDTWLNCTSELCDVEIHEDGVIEEAGCDTVEVDFANRYIGGGVLSRGRVQEEIRFTVCPELIVSMLFMEVMEDNEAIIIRGYEQFSQTEGYAADLRFAGDYRDPLQTDEVGNLCNTLCAIDAVSYRFEGNANNQYQDNAMLRELNKSFTGFCTPFTIPPSEVWKEEDFYTADEDAENEEVDTESSAHCEPPRLYRINLFAEDLLQRAMNLALPEAARYPLDRSSSISQGADDGSASDDFDDDIGQKLQDDIQMAHLEVNFREWSNRYRRRSSNLSDLSSRRSSYDLSRRSSACSTREYSSEFSSEFEDYFENFQQQERYKYHTIKEEVGCSAVNEFATNLAASLLRQGTLAACHLDNSVQMFHGEPPRNISQPRAIKLSSSGSTDDIKEISEESARKFVNRMFSGMWPFSSDDLCDVNSQNELKDEIIGVCQSRDDTVETLQNTENDNDENDHDDSCVTEADSLIFDMDKVDICDVSGLSEDEVLVDIADRIVAVAFEEALAEYRYRYVYNHSGRLQEQMSFDDSNQSEHSSEVKDQSDATCRSQLLTVSQSGSSANRAVCSSAATYNSSAVTVADQVMQKLFGPSTDEHSQSVRKEEKDGRSNIPNETETCDNSTGSFTDSDHLSHLHSMNTRDTKKQTTKQLEMYSRIADRLLTEGFSSRIVDKSVNTDPGNGGSVLNPSSDQSNYRSSSHDQMIDQSQVRDKIDQSQVSDNILVRTLSTSPTTNCDSFSSHSPLPNHAESNLETDTRKKTDERISRSSSLKSKSSKSSKAAVNRNSSSSSEGKCAIYKCDRPSSAGQSRSSSRQGKENISPPSGNSTSPANQSSGSDKTGSESSLHKQTVAQSGIHSLSVEDITHTGGARPKVRIPMLERQNAFNSKEDYDQFANSLSRDLLTNAFLQVQDDSEVVSYPRRSSEPMQISNGAALQRFENSIQLLNGRRALKSKTDEDMFEFEDEWSRYGEFGDKYERSSSGFRDPVLSRFAEELMKANVSVPTLQLLSDCLSTSGSSRSMCSTVSSFRDPLLASFEDELLTSSIKSAKTQMSWSKMKSTMCSPRLGEQRGSQNSNHSYRHSGNSSSGENDVNGISWKSYKSNSVVICSEGVSDFAEELSQRIVREATAVAFGWVDDSRNPYSCFYMHGRQRVTTVEGYGELLARKILRSAISTAENQTACSDWLEQNKIVTWCEETECLEYSGEENTDTSEGEDDRLSMLSSDTASTSVEYQDALDVPFYRLEEFADRLAARVLINSVAMSRREQLSALRSQYGRRIATGNWGCGAFCGDPHLKSLLQWMAASYAGTPCMMYYTFQHPKMARFQEVVDVVRDRGWDVSKLMQAVRRYCISVQIGGTPTHDLFDIILQGEIFPGM